MKRVAAGHDFRSPGVSRGCGLASLAARMLLAAGFAAWPALTGGQDAPPPQVRPPFAGPKPQVVSNDVLRLRLGSPIEGRLLNPTLRLRTPYATLELPVSHLISLRLAEGPDQLDRVFGIQSNRFSGFLEDATLQFEAQNGTRLALRRERVAEVTLAERAADQVKAPEPPRFLMRNGDSFAAQVRGGPFRLSTPEGDVAVTLEELDSIAFEDGRPVRARVRTRQGDRREGAWPETDLEVRLKLGPTANLYPTRIEIIDCRPDRPSSLPANSALGPSAPSSDINTRPAAPPGMVWIAPGEFLMGSPAEELQRDLDEGPQTRVTLTSGFWMGQCEVTQAEYQAVMGANPSLFMGDPRRPVERVSWQEAMQYCARLTRLHQAEGRLPEGHAYRLPTEAQWEYACRAGTSTRFSHGDDPEGILLEHYAWFSDNSDSSTLAVGTRRPNPWELHDMHGNVFEWCLDGDAGGFPGGSVEDYQAPGDGLLRVARGGSWLYPAKACRSANRDTYGVNTRTSDLGFRVVLAPILTAP
jgi:formylglycine-generating enzyme required for sulfatase activity